MWPKLRSQPLSLFGSMFSHMSIEHILGNLGALQVASETEEWLGTNAFAHLYLASGLLAATFRTAWQRSTYSNRATGSLGASGAISGVMAWWCIECAKRGSTLTFDGREMHPLWFWVLHVAIVVSGLLRVGKVQAMLISILEGEPSEGNDSSGRDRENNKKKEKESTAEIG